MFQRLYELNELIAEGSESPIEMLNEGLEPSYKYGLAICFDTTGEYKGVRLTEGSAGVIYIKGPPNGYDATLVSKYSGKVVKVVQRLDRNLNAVGNTELPDPIKPRMEQILANFEIQKIASDIDALLADLDTKTAYPFAYLAWLDGDEIRGLYQDKYVQDFAVTEVLSRYSRVKNRELTESDRVCAISGKVSAEIVGNFSLIACYNLDKRGFIVGGLDASMALKNFPVSRESILAVSGAWNYVRRHLTFRLAGERYLLLPQVRNPEVREYVLELLRQREEGQSLKKEALQTITNQEDEILEALAEVTEGRDSISMSMVFFEEKQASWRIGAEINQVLPSRIQEIYRVKRMVDADPILALKRGEPYAFTLRALRQFTGTRQDKQSHKQFMTYIDHIFAGGHVSRDVFMRDAVRVILTEFKRSANTAAFTVRDAWASWLFLHHLGVLTPTTGGKEIMTDGGDHYDAFMDKHAEFFDRGEKKVAFLTGCYVNTVAYVQRKNLANEPFLKKIQGVKMDKRRLQSLYHGAQTKLRQYQGMGLVAADLDPLLATAWIECGNKWNISDEEATFAFTLGLSLASKIKAQAETTNEQP